MTKKRQKIQERHYLDMFRRHYANFPEGQISESERPDFVVIGPEKVGIEVCNLYIRSGSDINSEQRQRTQRANLLRNVERSFEKISGIKRDFFLDFDPDFPVVDASEKVTIIAEKILDEIEGKQSLSKYMPFPDIPEIRHLHITDASGDRSAWNLNQVYLVPILNKDSLLEQVNAKVKKSFDFQSCDKQWLLLVIDFWDRAQDQMFRQGDFVQIAKTPFEKILLYKTVTHEVIELQQGEH